MWIAVLRASMVTFRRLKGWTGPLEKRWGRGMNRSWLLTVPLLIASQGVSAGVSAMTATGRGALALASLVADQSPTIRARDRTVLRQMFNGRAAVTFPVGQKIEVRADSVVCRVGNVDITQHDCTLTFGNRTVREDGRRAHEFYTTLIEVGVRPEGAAGSLHFALSALVCNVDPQVIRQRAGGGAECSFTTAAP